MDNQLNIIVLLKQIPDIEKVRFDFKTGRLDRRSAEAVINPFDLNALEVAVEIKEKVGARITAISMGPRTAEASLRDAIATVPQILRSGIIPLAIEYVGLKKLNATAAHLGEERPIQSGNAQLLIIVSGSSEDEVYSTCERISEVAEKNNAGEALIAETRDEQERSLKIRSNMYTALKGDAVDILDAAVPIGSLLDLIMRIDELSKKYGVYLPVYGHAGDENLHIHLMKESGEVPKYADDLKGKSMKLSSASGES